MRATDKGLTHISRAWTLAIVVIGMGLVAFNSAAAALEGIHKIQHVVIIMQENRSFDSYFGTYPGANGIPAGVCVSDSLHGGCVRPFHDPNDENFGGPHGRRAAVADIDGGKMDGFVSSAEAGMKCSTTEPTCSPCNVVQTNCIDVMGYHDAQEIPNYWIYAQNFVLQDSMFESATSWSLPEHLFMVSGWSAKCPNGNINPMECSNAPEGGHSPDLEPEATFSWTDITYLLAKSNASWRYYVFQGGEPDCESDEAMACVPGPQGAMTPGIWNPLAYFTDVKEDGQRQNIQSLSSFYTAVHEPSSCGLPNVSWIDPNGKVSEHPTALISRGQAYVTTLVNAIMRSSCWSSTAIFISWDDWGGFYDHVVPPIIDENGYGIRVPGLVISPYARAGYIDHQELSHDAYLKFIEDDFLGSGRLNPKTDGRPDRRPSVREEAPGLGNLESDFDFNQAPRAPLLLPAYPAPGPTSIPPGVARASPTPVPKTPQLTLQLTVSIAPRQDLRLHHGQVYLMAGCNIACSLYARGHLNMIRHHRHLGLRAAHATLTESRALRIALGLSRKNLRAIRHVLLQHRTVRASVELGATAVDGLHKNYRVTVILTWR